MAAVQSLTSAPFRRGVCSVQIMTRKPIKKSTRFNVFARDGFTCRYCGRKSDEVKLVIDHIIPVAKSGTNDEVNLITSCDECNSGKGVKDARPDMDNENVRLSAMQSMREQKQAARAAIEGVKSAKKIRQTMADFWMEQTGREKADASTISVMLRYAESHGFATVCGWIMKAALKCGYSDTAMGKYVSGIRRKIAEELEAAK